MAHRILPSSVATDSELGAASPCGCCLLDKWHYQSVYMACYDGLTYPQVFPDEII